MVILSLGIWRHAFVLAGIAVIAASGALFLFGSSFILGNVFARRNNLARPFLAESSSYLLLYEEYKKVKHLALFRGRGLAWGVPVHDVEYGIIFLENGDAVVWARLRQDFPHLVIDALGNKRLFTSNIQKENLPPQRVTLEGAFPKYFNVYIERGKQVLALQILSPDRMAMLIKKLRQFDLEIKDGYLKMYVVGVQKSSVYMQSFVALLGDLANDLKIERISKIKPR